ncbi:MAG: D-aminoacyl-tRNA deacylase [Marinobacter sp.]|uniref:D-aminoacyl-tRNA deacylase n=1 Tax=Marinobacter sp. TaxID=50741 RepID=UPI00299D915F|nr:D-aminoacyl-tRNA deacylase [Marinobacter sp.]MDX1635351.1 D-aminoacyl-tRNA deacylase [Marinobacter sp.]
MKGLIQRVSQASVAVDGKVIGEIAQGLLLFLGIERNDDTASAEALGRRIAGYRVFPDAQGRMNQSLLDTGGSLLVVSQFTLAADTRSGTRPGFSTAAAPEQAESLYQSFLAVVRELLGSHRVACGQFGADMKVALVNDGPVTFLLESGGAIK